MTEEWRPVVGWEGLYEVSDQGRVRSLRRSVPSGTQEGRSMRGGNMLRNSIDRDGYSRVGLSNGRRRGTRILHRLVLEAFVGPAPEGMEARHLDGNPANNTLANLAWSTHTENIRDRARHGTWGRRALDRGHCKYGHPFDEANTYINPRTGSPTCRTCRREGMRAAYRKKATA